LYLAKKAALNIIERLNFKLSIEDQQDLFSDCYLNLVERTLDQKRTDVKPESLNYYYRKGNNWYVNNKIKQMSSADKNKIKTISISKLNGKEREIVDNKQEFISSNVLAYTGCPHAEYVQRIILDGEEVTQVFDSKYEVKLWYTKMLPEIKEYLKDLYDLGDGD